MKSFVALCFLAAICAMQASADNPLDQFKDAVETSKKNVLSTTANLGYTKGELSRTVHQNLDTLRNQSISNIDNTANLALDEIRTKVDAATAEGKDVEHCYVTALATLHNIFGAAFSGFHACETTGRSQLQQLFVPLDTAMATGYTYLRQLNSIYSQCYQSGTSEIQTCITEKLRQINESIKTYQSEANKLILNAQNGVKDVTNAVSSCFIEPVSTARSATTDLRSATDKCIEN